MDVTEVTIRDMYNGVGPGKWRDSSGNVAPGSLKVFYDSRGKKKRKINKWWVIRRRDGKWKEITVGNGIFLPTWPLKDNSKAAVAESIYTYL